MGGGGQAQQSHINTLIVEALTLIKTKIKNTQPQTSDIGGWLQLQSTKYRR